MIGINRNSLGTRDWLADRAVASPDALALNMSKESWTYAELDAATDGFCHQLLEIGIAAGEHVGVLMFNRFEYVCLIHALARIGAVLVPFNTRLTAVELEAQRSYVGCTVVICDGTLEATATELNATIYSVDEPKLEGIHPLLASPSLGEGLLVGRQHSRREPASAEHFSLDNLQAIVFTSGTTGAPKGVMLTFSNHFWSATASAFRLGLDQKDRWLNCIPLYHVGGLSVVFRSCLYGTAIDLHSRFDVEAIYRNLVDAPVTMISVVPTMLVRLIERFDNDPEQQNWPSSLRHILLGGAAATPDLLAECQKQSLPISTTYGLTEVGSQAVTLTPQDLATKLERSKGTQGKLGSVGKPLMFTRIRIIERDENGNIIGEAPVNGHGEITVSGPTVMQGYYDNPEATAKTLIETDYGTELLTGDIGYLDEDGDLWVLQRRSDMIVSGGENIYPSEVEAALRSHPDVVDACVVGVPDPEWGQVVAAMVVVSKSIEEASLLTFGRERLASYKLPRRVSFAGNLPQTASGKVHRKEVERTLLKTENR